MRRRILVALAAFLICAGTVPGQTGTAYEAELSVPFGTASGKLLLLGQYMVFYDNGNPDASFVVPRAQVAKMNADGSNVTVQLTEPLRFRDGPRSQLNFRLLQMENAAALTGWQNAGNGGEAAVAGAGAGAPRTAADIKESYEARHEHTFGACNGRLLTTSDRLVFESLDNADHSRSWPLSEIRQIRQRNPTRLVIDSQGGERYEMTLTGSGMNNQEFQALVDSIAKARVQSR